MAIGGVAVDVDFDALAAVCRDHGVRGLALFGSVLRDDFTPTSDIDVLVEANSPVEASSSWSSSNTLSRIMCFTGTWTL